jgi:hypothetical protein
MTAKRIFAPVDRIGRCVPQIFRATLYVIGTFFCFAAQKVPRLGAGLRCKQHPHGYT